MAFELQVGARYVGHQERSYDSFQRGDETVPAGVTRTITVMPDGSAEPLKLRAAKDLPLSPLNDWPFGQECVITLVCYPEGTGFRPVVGGFEPWTGEESGEGETPRRRREPLKAGAAA